MRVRLKHERLAAALAKSRRSQNAWAIVLGISPGHLSRLVNGRRPYPNPKTRERLLRGLELQFEDLFEIEAATDSVPAASARRKRRGQWPDSLPVSQPIRKGHRSMLFKDLRFAARILLRHRVSTALCLAVLGLGFGAVISVFTLVHQFLLSPLPYPDSERLVMIFSRYSDGGLTALSPLVLRDFRERSRSLEAIGAYDTQPVHLLSGGDPVRIVAARFSEGLPEILGMKTRLGRTFEASEMIAGQDAVAVLSHSLWRSRFGGDSSVLGKRINIDDVDRTVVGVAGADFQFPEQADIFVPLALTEIWYGEDRRGWEFLTGVGRAAAEIRSEQVSAELSGILAEVAPRRAARGQGAEAVPLQERLLGDRKTALLTILLSASFLALMAWFNVANLLLARAESRSAEFSLRMALGSGRSGVLKLLLAESSILGLIGGLLGLLASYAILELFRTQLDEYLNLPGTLELPLPVVLIALGVSILTGILFGLIPALRASGMRLAETLKKSARIGSARRAGRFWRTGLVAAQVAISVCLLIAVSLLIASFVRLIDVNPGFVPDRLLSLRLELPPSRYDIPRRGEFHRRLLEEARSLPGVADAALTYALPLTGRVWTASFQIEGRPSLADRSDPGGNIRPVSADYFKTMRIPLLEGRFFEDGDSVNAPLAAIVDSALARRFWPGKSPLGERLLDIAGDRPVTIVGVVGAARDMGLHVESNGHLYFPLSQRPDIRQFNLVVRAAASDPMTLAPALSARIRHLDAALPIFGVTTLDQHVAGTLRSYRRGVALVTVFGIIAVILAAAGIYGVGSYSAVSRTGELGVRLALGAQRRQLLRMMLTDNFKASLPGLVLGLVLARMLSQTIESFIYGVEADWGILLPATGLMALICLLAGLQPAWRAARTDCLEAIRWE